MGLWDWVLLLGGGSSIAVGLALIVYAALS